MASITASLSRTAGWVVIVVWFIVRIGAVRAEGSQLELAVKATYLYKLAPFVEWPNPAAEFPGNVFPICIAGRDPFGAVLDRAVSGQSVAGHPIVVRRYQVITGNPGCAVVYITGSDTEPAAVILAALHAAPVLTVTDQDFDPKVKGIINFVVRDNRVRFQIDEATAAEDGLTISSKLLSLAVSVRQRPPSATAPR
ncbi:MAG TPA: YfiR family protein [Acetobacteraceae bacterium]|nr:YfiR family protein [Acetobacteraceae bacterium]